MSFKKRGFIHAIIPGHGGVDENGEYQILKEGSKQALVDGRMIYEGEHNRYIVDEIFKQATSLGVKAINLIPEIDDISLSDRVQRINDAYDMWAAKGYRLLVWECHLNAFNGNVEGTEVYSTVGDNFSDKMASIWWDEMGEVFPDHKKRPDYGDGDVDKEANFKVIWGSKAYAILMEFFFFDNKKEVDKFCNPQGYARWASTVVRAMSRIDTTINANSLSLI